MASLPPLERGIRLLELAVSSSDGITYKEAHEYLGVTTVTVARLLKVLVQMGYLVQENGHYKAGPAVQRLSAKNENIQWLLNHHGDSLSQELADMMHESCVAAVYLKNCFEFTGVTILEDSFSYTKRGHKIYSSTGHVLNLISHATMSPKNVKERFFDKDDFFGSIGSRPEWKDYVKSIVSGMEYGYFLELGWRRPHLFRISIPVFSEDGSLAGALFSGFHSHESLMEHIEIFKETTFRILSRIDGYQAVFGRGMEKLRQNLKLWQNEFTQKQTKVKEAV